MTKPVKLDIEKFRKVQTLVIHGTTSEERAAAKDQVHLLSAEALLTVEGTTALLDQLPQEQTTFESLSNHPPFATKRQEREKQRAYAREVLLKEMGSEEAIWCDTPREAALSAAVDHLKDWLVVTKRDGTVERIPAGLDGLPNGFGLKDVSGELQAAIVAAYPFPKSLTAALAEYCMWDKLHLDRNLFGNYEHWWWSDIRIMLLKDVLENKPVIDWDDLHARMQWWSVKIERGMVDWRAQMESLRQRLLLDLEVLKNGCRTADQPFGPDIQRQTATQRAEEVQRLLAVDPTASNRAIATQVGVSPQTVANWRKKLLCAAEQASPLR